MLAALLCLSLAAPAPINGWPAAQAPSRRVLPLDLSRLDEQTLLRPGSKKAALYALGSGPQDYRKDRLPVILVHGIKGSPRDLQAVADRLQRADRQLHILAYDSWTRRTSVTGDDFAEELRALQKFIGQRREVVIVAHSMGGLVSRRALVNLQLSGLRWLEGFKRVRLLTIDSPWHGYGGPSDRGFEGLLMNVARPFMPDALEDMRAGSAMFQGDPNGQDALARTGLLKGTLPENAEVEVVFAQQGTDIWDYTEPQLAALAPALVAYFTNETPVAGVPWLLNFWNGLIQANAYFAFQDELRALGDAGTLDTAAVSAALLKHYPRFPGDHMGVLLEHPGQRSALDWLADKLK